MISQHNSIISTLSWMRYHGCDNMMIMLIIIWQTWRPLHDWNNNNIVVITMVQYCEHTSEPAPGLYINWSRKLGEQRSP